MAIQLKVFDWKKEHLSVSSWLYNVQEHSQNIQATRQRIIAEELIIRFAAKLFKGEATTLWFTLKHSGYVPMNWDTFNQAVKRSLYRLIMKDMH